MRSSVVALWSAVIVVVGATALFTSADVPEAPSPEPAVSAASSWDADVESFDGTAIAITVYRPANATVDAPVPVVLHSHGWSGSRTTDGSGIVGKLWDAGFGVVSIDARGHGESGGYATVHHQDAEVKDTMAVLDWIHDELDWVRKEPTSGVAKDVVAGGAGYSYAGGMQLTAASHDARLDAIAPEITWGDLPTALAPAGVPKSLWLDFLYGTAKESGTRIDPRIDEWYQTILLENRIPEEALAHFEGSSAIPEQIRADVLLIQGVPDVLFNLNQAIGTYERLEAAGAGDVRLFTHLTGHVAPYAQPFGTTLDRRDIFEDETPCGTLSDMIVRWLDEKLDGGPASGIPEVSWALDDGECVTADALPDETLDARAPLAIAPAGAGTTFVPLAQGPFVVAGIPRLSATADALGPGGVVFAGLVVLGADGYTRVVDDQTMPIRLAPGDAIDVDLAGVAARLGPADQLLLRLDGVNEWYAHNADRAPGGLVLRDIQVTLPIVQ